MFRAVRRPKSTGFVLVVLGTVLGTGLGVGVDLAVTSTSKAVPKASSISVSTRYNFEQIQIVGRRIELLGLDFPAANKNAPSNVKCVSEFLDTQTFRLGKVSIGPCSIPSVWAETSNPYTNHTTLRIAHRNPKTGKVSIGPVVMAYEDASDTHLAQISGDGSIWFYDCCSSKGAEVLRVSPSTGQVENVVHMPMLFRPILATNDDGLWIGVATNGGYPPNLSGSPIYHVAPGSNRAKLVFVGGHATFWMVASGHSVWVDIGTPSQNQQRLLQTIWRFDGSSARRVFHVPMYLPFGITVIGDASEGLWTVASQLPRGSSSNVDTDTVCTTSPAAVGIDPNTGQQRVVATLPPGTGSDDIDCLAQDLEGQQAVISGGYMYLLEDTVVGKQAAGFTRLFRIRDVALSRVSSQGMIAGRLLRVGGAAPGTPVGVRGTVSATNVATRATFQASTTSAGVFTVSVPDGTYRLSGRSSLINGGKRVGKAKALVHVRAGQTSHANVYFQVK